jgi:hypothetical protein
MNKLEEVINDLVREKTLSLAGVNAVKEMRDENIRISNLNRDYIEKNQQLCESLALYKEKEQSVLDRENLVISLEESVKERERKITQLECDAQAHRAVSEAYLKSMELVFRNTEIRKNKITTGNNGDYINTVEETTEENL